MKAGYSAATAAPVALVAATAKTVLNVISPAQFGTDLLGFTLSFDGVTASAVPVVVELCSSTQAGAGTPAGAATLNQEYGRAITTGFTAQYGYTAEPTVLTVLQRFHLTPNGGLLVRDFVLGQTPDVGVSTGLALRLTAPAAVNCHAVMRFERC